MKRDSFSGYKRVPMELSSKHPCATHDAEALMIRHGFQKVEWHCVYEGPVARLVKALKKTGWTQQNHSTNPYLLAHKDSVMTFNYAESNTKPSSHFVAFFRGIP